MPTSKRYLDKETSFRGRYSREVFQSLYFAYRPMSGRILLFIFLGFVGRLLLLANTNLMGFWVDSYCLQVAPAGAVCRPVPEVLQGFDDRKFLATLTALTAVGFVLTAIFRIGFSRLSAEAVSRFYDEVTLRTSRLPIRFFDTNPVGRIVTRFSSDYGSVFRLFGGPLAEFFAIVFDLICMLVLIGVASPLYLPIIATVAVANYGVYRLNRERLRAERRELAAGRSPSIAHFAETTQGASTIRIFGRQTTFLKRFARLNDRYLEQRLRTSSAVLKFSMQMGALTSFLFLATGIGGYWMAREGWVSIGSIAVAFTFIAFSGTSLQMFFEWFAQFEEAMTSVERMNDYLRRPLEPGAKLPASRKFATDHPVYDSSEERRLEKLRILADSRCAGLTVRDLWFRYAEDLPYVLKGVDFEVRAGEKIGIVGRTGSGKTSFVQALFHLYPFERGAILLDGKGPEIDLAAFRRAIALISQEPTLFRGSLRENLDLAAVHGDDKLVEALERVGLGEWLRSLPAGLESAVEERGRNLSAGERQLLCMARCLLQDAPLIVMDEATSSIDPQSEEILVRATHEFFADRTQVIIAHRLSTLKDCDRILWLHKGEIRMLDTPDKVLPVFQASELV